MLILVAWAGSLGWLVERHYFGLKADAPRWAVPPGSSFLAIRLGERQVGIRSVTVDTLAAGLRLVELVTLDMPAVVKGMPRRTSMRTEALYTRGLQLQRFLLNLLTENGREERSGQVLGDSLLQLVNVPQGSAPETLMVRLRRPVVLPSAVPFVVASRGLAKAGDHLSVEIYDPVNLVVRVDRFTVAAESLFVVADSAIFSPTLKRWSTVHSDTVRAWRLDGLAEGLPAARWFDATGMVVRTRNPLGTVMERSAFEMVQTNFRSMPAPPWDTASSAPRFLQDTASPPARKSLVVQGRLALPDDSLPTALTTLTGGWQRRFGDTIRVGEPDPAAHPDSSPDPRTAPLWTLYRADSSLLPVVAKATGKKTEPMEVAAALASWVRKNIGIRRGPGLSSATRVLAARRGNEAERVILLGALAQTAGLAARPVWGLVRVNEHWELRNWIEIWTGHWLPLDPAMAPALDAGRIRLGIGGMGRLMDLALRGARLRFDVLEETR
jgi:hypothetical protein